MRSPRPAYFLLPVLVLFFAALLTWTLAARSTIPVALRGTVSDVDVRDEHPGVHNAWFVRLGGGYRHVDRAVGERLTRGDVISKDAWDRTLTVNGKAVPLGLSHDARSALWFGPALVFGAVAVAAVAWPRRTRSRPR